MPGQMRRALLAFGAAIVLFLVYPAPAPAQQHDTRPVAPSDTLYEVRLTNGETYVARVVAVTADSISLETTAGARIQVSRAAVTILRPAHGRLVGGSFWREDPNRSRLFFSPTGRGLRKGDGYFGVYEVYIPFIAYAPTDRLILAGGSPFYLALLGDITPPVYFGPKLLLVDRPSFAGSAGAMVVVFPESGGTESAGVVYGVGTYGSADRAITGGLGWGFVGSDLSSKPVVLMGAENRTSRMTKLVTENLVVLGSDGGALLSAGMRFFGERLSADAALAGFFAADDATCCFPVVNFVYHFGSARSR